MINLRRNTGDGVDQITCEHMRIVDRTTPMVDSRFGERNDIHQRRTSPYADKVKNKVVS